MNRMLCSATLSAALSLGMTAAYADEDEDKKVRICHKGTETIMVSERGAWAHAINHGDERGYCPGDEPDDLEEPLVSAVIMMRCDNDRDGALVVTALSVAQGQDVVNPLDELPDGYTCPQALRRMLNAEFSIENVTSGGGGSGMRVEYLLVR